jgi:tetrahydromethanopterin S-methyltransferase subunit B
MSDIAQEVILKEIARLKNQLNSLETTVKDYFLWLEGRTYPTIEQTGRYTVCWICGRTDGKHDKLSHESWEKSFSNSNL